MSAKACAPGVLAVVHRGDTKQSGKAVLFYLIHASHRQQANRLKQHKHDLHHEMATR